MTKTTDSVETFEKQRVLYWDTYQSWVDKLPENHSKVNLFCGHPRGVPRSVCNFSGYGCFPSDQSVKIIGIGAQSKCSSDIIEMSVADNAVIDLIVGDKTAFELPLPMALSEGDAVSAFERAKKEEGAIIKRIGDQLMLFFNRSIAVPPRQMMRVSVNFNDTAERHVRHIEKKIGPGAGWAKIVVYLLCDIKRTNY
ncbi:MAG: hypothetical protein ACYS7Y_16025 [Planctomycetota bacterium]|jgi:hypothetical protein